MKRIFLLVFALIFIFVFCVPVAAHSGRTDGNGGHYDRSNGEYHYHHGHSAHQHTGGDCPYESNGFLGLDWGTFFLCLLIFTFFFSLLTFKLDLGRLLSKPGEADGCLSVLINLGIALILAFIVIIIIRTVIV